MGNGADKTDKFEKDLEIIFAHEADSQIEYIEKHENRTELVEAVARDIINGEEADEELITYLLSQPMEADLHKALFEVRKEKAEAARHNYLKTMLPFIAGMALIAWWLFTHEV